jgi:hypothetical protein
MPQLNLWNKVVDAGGNGNHTTIIDALDDLGPSYSKFTMYVKGGSYTGALTILNDVCEIELEPQTTLGTLTIDGDYVSITFGPLCVIDRIVVNGDNNSLYFKNSCTVKSIELASGTQRNTIQGTSKGTLIQEYLILRGTEHHISDMRVEGLSGNSAVKLDQCNDSVVKHLKITDSAAVSLAVVNSDRNLITQCVYIDGDIDTNSDRNRILTNAFANVTLNGDSNIFIHNRLAGNATIQGNKLVFGKNLVQGTITDTSTNSQVSDDD